MRPDIKQDGASQLVYEALRYYCMRTDKEGGQYAEGLWRRAERQTHSRSLRYLVYLLYWYKSTNTDTEWHC